MSEKKENSYASWNYINELIDQINAKLNQPKQSKVGTVIYAIFNYLLLVFFAFIINKFLFGDKFDFLDETIFAVVLTGLNIYFASKAK